MIHKLKGKNAMLPLFLKPDDIVGVISPSGCIAPEYIDGAVQLLEKWGYKVSEGEFCRIEYGRFAGTEKQRIADLQNALNDDSIRAILCSRGGYGLAQIIDKIDFTKFVQNPKWLIGFSDITILHSAVNNLNIASLHSVMAKHLTELSADLQPIELLKNILGGNLPVYELPFEKPNRIGSATGKLIGGNLSVLAGMRGTPFDLNFKNNILFIEDTDEELYHIDRMIQNLRIGGVLSEISGLIVGQFSVCEEDPRMMKSLMEIISDAVSDYNYPVCFNFPAGHVENNLPLVLGSNACLDINSKNTKLTFIDKM